MRRRRAAESVGVGVGVGVDGGIGIGVGVGVAVLVGCSDSLHANNAAPAVSAAEPIRKRRRVSGKRQSEGGQGAQLGGGEPTGCVALTSVVPEWKVTQSGRSLMPY